MAPEAPRVQGLLPGQLIDGFELLECLHYGNAAAAIVVSRLSCSEAMPALAEVKHMIEKQRAVGQS